MGTKLQNKIDAIKERSYPIFIKYPIKRVGLFGSIVRGEDTINSDVDMLIEFAANSEISLLDLAHIKNSLEDVLKREVDIVEYSQIKKDLRPYILPTEIRIYEKNVRTLPS